MTDMVMRDDGTGYVEVGVAAGTLLRLPLDLLSPDRYDGELLVFSVQPLDDPSDRSCPDVPARPRETWRLKVERVG